MVDLDCDRALQAWMPSYHVCPKFELPALPQFRNQEPPRPQQLVLPDFSMAPHLRHTELIIVVVTAGGVGIGKQQTHTHTNTHTHTHTRARAKVVGICSVRASIYLHIPAFGLTFAGLHALKPPVVDISVTGTPTVLIPSTARSATTNSAGFQELSTLWARPRISNC